MSRLGDIENAIVALQGKVEAYKPLSGLGTSVADAAGGNGRVINAKQNPTSPTVSANNQPWAPGIAPDDNTKVIIAGEAVLESFINSGGVTIDDLAASFTIGIGDVIYLDLTYDSGGTVTNYTLVGGAQWTDYPQPYATTGAGTLEDPYVIEHTYCLIAIGKDPEDGNANKFQGPIVDDVKICRRVFSPLIMAFTDLGAGFVVPFPVQSSGGPV